MKRGPKRRLGPYLMLPVVAGFVALVLSSELNSRAAGEPVSWKNPWVLLLLFGCVVAAWASFHLRLGRTGALAYSRVHDLAPARRGWISRLATLPAVLRIVALGCLVFALARPQTFRTEVLKVEGIDIMFVLDLSRSMEETDLARNRLDAGQRTIRKFLENRESDRVGLVVFARESMLQCPLTLDYKSLDSIVADLAIGDVPPGGTAVGDALGLALASLRRSEAKSKVIILISDGFSNTSLEMDPEEAKATAVDMGVRTFTVLVGRESGVRLYGRRRHEVNPRLLQELAKDTGGTFFRAGDDAALDESFAAIRKDLEKSEVKVVGRTPDAELFPLFLLAALILLLLERLLLLTRWRRFP